MPRLLFVPVKVGALYLQPQVDAVGADRLIQYAIERHLVLLPSSPRVTVRMVLPPASSRVIRLPFTLIVSRLAAAGEAIQTGLVHLEVQRHQAIAAHIDRQLAVHDLAGTALLQAAAGVEAEAGIDAVIDGDLKVGAGLVPVDLLAETVSPRESRSLP